MIKSPLMTATSLASPELDASPSPVLIIFPGALGDLVCLMPALRALASRHERSSIELMARGELAKFAVGRLGVARGHAIDRPEVSLLFTASDDADPRAREFFAGFTRIYSFFAADDATFRLMLTKAGAGRVSFHPFRPISFDGAGHVGSAYLRSIGETETAEPMEVSLTLAPEDVAAGSRILADHRLKAGNFTLLMPGSGSPRKNWPAGKFAELARLLPAAQPAAILLGPAETDLEPYFRERRLPVLKDLELGEVAAVARMARGFVGNDSGVSHLAAAAGTPGVVLFGPTDPLRWRPLGAVKVLSFSALEDLPVAEVARELSEIEAQRNRG